MEVKEIIAKWMHPDPCKLLGHKKVYLEKLYEGEINGWFCDRCDLTYDQDKDKYY